jgi:sucrose-6-phosphate hydrolase SacC (GH32 family)
MNDPNGPFYDPNHALYHLFYQDHIGRPVPETFPQGFEGPSWGHAVSPDMVRWAHSPVALWNGEHWYDVHALFTGSATVVNGEAFLVFPGVCDLYPPSGKIPGCRYGYTFGVARPSEPSDPFLTNWTKSELNPVMNDTFDDPSTAWITPEGELRWIANCGDGRVGDCGPNGTQAPLYGASDASFSSAYKIGFTNLDAGECPSLYPLPPLSPGTTPAPRMPTHVHKWGCEPYKDCVDIGTWTEGSTKRREVGRWESMLDTRPVVIDRGSSYAAKDLDDAKRGRRISFAWARLEPSEQGEQINGDVQSRSHFT